MGREHRTAMGPMLTVALAADGAGQLGARGDDIVWAAWILSFVALGALAGEAAILTRRLAGRTAAIGAAVMTLSCGGLVWCAASGMEVVPFAFCLARAARRSSEWASVWRK